MFRQCGGGINSSISSSSSRFWAVIFANLHVVVVGSRLKRMVRLWWDYDGSKTFTILRARIRRPLARSRPSLPFPESVGHLGIVESRALQRHQLPCSHEQLARIQPRPFPASQPACTGKGGGVEGGGRAGGHLIGHARMHRPSQSGRYNGDA